MSFRVGWNFGCYLKLLYFPCIAIKFWSMRFEIINILSSSLLISWTEGHTVDFHNINIWYSLTLHLQALQLCFADSYFCVGIISVPVFFNLLCRFLTFICGGIGLVIVGLMTRKWWRERTRKLKEQTRKKQASTQIKRQRNVQKNEQPEMQVCVVCCQNHRGIILLPCGHVCLCEDCSERITDFCPVCRTEIETKAVAYIS